ncbi:MAG: type II toxin-antitoxin system VapC family toxin [Bryobacterales bacterium]|nr:type II toxin-antitoxin system VapC family toxin [Bryobacterales bacterium]
MGGLDAAAARKAILRFEMMVEDSFVVLLPDLDDFDRARGWLGHFDSGLRAADALHLAIAGNRGADPIISLDKLMIAVGKALGLPTSAGTLPGYGN